MIDWILQVWYCETWAFGRLDPGVSIRISEKSSWSTLRIASESKTRVLYRGICYSNTSSNFIHYPPLSALMKREMALKDQAACSVCDIEPIKRGTRSTWKPVFGRDEIERTKLYYMKVIDIESNCNPSALLRLKVRRSMSMLLSLAIIPLDSTTRSY